MNSCQILQVVLLEDLRFCPSPQLIKEGRSTLKHYGTDDDKSKNFNSNKEKILVLMGQGLGEGTSRSANWHLKLTTHCNFTIQWKSKLFKILFW